MPLQKETVHPRGPGSNGNEEYSTPHQIRVSIIPRTYLFHWVESAYSKPYRWG